MGGIVYSYIKYMEGANKSGGLLGSTDSSSSSSSLGGYLENGRLRSSIHSNGDIVGGGSSNSNNSHSSSLRQANFEFEAEQHHQHIKNKKNNILWQEIAAVAIVKKTVIFAEFVLPPEILLSIMLFF